MDEGGNVADNYLFICKKKKKTYCMHIKTAKVSTVQDVVDGENVSRETIL